MINKIITFLKSFFKEIDNKFDNKFNGEFYELLELSENQSNEIDDLKQNIKDEKNKNDMFIKNTKQYRKKVSEYKEALNNFFDNQSEKNLNILEKKSRELEKFQIYRGNNKTTNEENLMLEDM